MRKDNTQDNFNDILLSSSTSIRRYRELEAAQNRSEIAKFIYQRFWERYIAPFESMSHRQKHGFSIMAVSCLMIEALESFRQGYLNTDGKSSSCFQGFLQKTKHLGKFKDISVQFYKNVRCGILHQAETTGGWRIRRDGPLFDGETRTINATQFLSCLKKELKQYQLELESSDWSSILWENLRNKTDAIIENCRRNQ